MLGARGATASGRRFGVVEECVPVLLKCGRGPAATRCPKHDIARPSELDAKALLRMRVSATRPFAAPPALEPVCGRCPTSCFGHLVAVERPSKRLIRVSFRSLPLAPAESLAISLFAGARVCDGCGSNGIAPPLAQCGACCLFVPQYVAILVTYCDTMVAHR